MRKSEAKTNTDIEIENFGVRDRYYVDTVGKDAARIAKYIQNQLKEDQELCQLELDLDDPFKGSK